jgi:hypothetical protein
VTSRPFLGETNDRERASPGVVSLEITVTQDPYEEYAKYPSQRSQRFTKETIPKHAACLNPRCQQGGLDLQSSVLHHPPGHHSFWCNGHEGSPQGRRKGDSCDNRFDVTLAVVRTES